MNLQNLGAGFPAKAFRSAIAGLCAAALLSLGQMVSLAQTEAAPPPGQADAPKIPNDQLDSLVAPIALFPDPLLAQTLAASTYPLEIIQLQQWLGQNKTLKDKALADAVAKQNWDPSVQSMAGLPDLVERLAGNIRWTTDLGNAFLAQQADVFDAVQRMRAKAQSKGALQSSPQQTVETQAVDGGKEVIVIQQPNPQVVYIPSYDPAVVYGPPAYPYYPHTYPGYMPGMGLAFGAGIIAGGALGNWGNWGNCNWGGGDITINNTNNFNRNNINTANINRGQGGSGQWQHNAQHRGNAPYGDRGTAERFGGNARQQPTSGVGDRSRGGAGAGSRTGAAAGIANRPDGGGANIGNRSGSSPGIAAGGSRPGVQPGTRPSGGSPNRVGSQDLGGGSRGGGGFSDFGGGGGGGSSNAGARGAGGQNLSSASSHRGGQSMKGGGLSGGGGGRGGGGHRGGGGRGR